MFRKIKKAEIPKVANLLRQYWKTRGMNYPKKWAEDYLKKGHKHDIKEDNFFVLEGPRGSVIGVISSTIFEGDVAELRDLVVTEKYRGLGHGKRLVNEALEYCKSKNVRKVYGFSRYETEGLLRALGFHVEGVLRNHFAEGEDLLIMSKFLK